ncbi:hypothetical protein [Phreatobacter sp.]|uniref:hypothetical protein n=1 Tax=Phreatobacter sp. TaxID=1966341 RepID=UPI003F7009EA
MTRTALLSVPLALGLAAMVLPASSLQAQPAGAAAAPSERDAATGRFILRDSPEGLLRMDTRSGQMSICARQSGNFACRLVPDDRTALTEEVERLKAENETLRRGGGSALVRPAPEQRQQLPSDAEVDRALSIAERVWRRLLGLIRETEPEQGRRL